MCARLPKDFTIANVYPKLHCFFLKPKSLTKWSTWYKRLGTIGVVYVGSDKDEASSCLK